MRKKKKRNKRNFAALGCQRIVFNSTIYLSFFFCLQLLIRRDFIFNRIYISQSEERRRIGHNLKEICNKMVWLRNFHDDCKILSSLLNKNMLMCDNIVISYAILNGYL